MFLEILSWLIVLSSHLLGFILYSCHNNIVRRPLTHAAMVTKLKGVPLFHTEKPNYWQILQCQDVSIHIYVALVILVIDSFTSSSNGLFILVIPKVFLHVYRFKPFTTQTLTKNNFFKDATNLDESQKGVLKTLWKCDPSLDRKCFLSAYIFLQLCLSQ